MGLPKKAIYTLGGGSAASGIITTPIVLQDQITTLEKEKDKALALGQEALGTSQRNKRELKEERKKRLDRIREKLDKLTDRWVMLGGDLEDLKARSDHNDKTTWLTLGSAKEFLDRLETDQDRIANVLGRQGTQNKKDLQDLKEMLEGLRKNLDTLWSRVRPDFQIIVRRFEEQKK